jgi:hypothetical protein
MGRVCPWELFIYLRQRQWRRARVRFAPAGVAVPLDGGIVWTWYYRPGEFERPFVAAGFVRVALRSTGLIVPPPYTKAFADRHPRLLAWLRRADDWAGARPGLRTFGDRFLIVLRRA